MLSLYPVGMKTVTANLTTTSLADIIPAESGFQLLVLGVFATNNDATTNSLKLFNGDTSVTPDMHIGGSGTFIWDYPAIGNFRTAIGSGLGGALGASGSFTITAHYALIDKRTPVTKSSARNVSQTPITTRTPDAFGNQ